MRRNKIVSNALLTQEINNFFVSYIGQPAALEAIQCDPSKDSEKRYFGAKSIRSLEKIQILALEMAIFQKCGPRTDLGWPWLTYCRIQRNWRLGFNLSCEACDNPISLNFLHNNLVLICIHFW